MNVSTLWFNSLYMAAADGVQLGCANIDALEMEVSGTFKQLGPAVFSAGVDLSSQTLNVNGATLNGLFKLEGGMNATGQELQLTNAALKGAFDIDGLATFTENVEMAGQVIGLEGASLNSGAGELTIEGNVRLNGVLNATSQTIVLKSAVLQGDFETQGEVKVGGGLVLSGQTLTMTGSTMWGGFTVNGLASFVNGVDFQNQIVQVGGANLYGGFTATGLTSFNGDIHVAGRVSKHRRRGQE